MARKNVETGRKRAERLSTRRKKLEKRFTEKRTYEVDGRFAGEVTHMKFLAVTMRLATYKNQDIADATGETLQVVEGWFQETEVKDLYMATLENMSHNAMELLKSYTLEAIHVMVEVMRHGNYKEAMDAAKEILDRGGVPKVSKSESMIEKKETHGVDEDVIARIQEAAGNPEQEEAIKPFIEMLEKAAANED